MARKTKKKTVRKKTKANRLSEATVLRIKNAIVARKNRNPTLVKLADKFGVSVARISWINSGRSYAKYKVAGWNKRIYNPYSKNRKAA